ncbi:hypothetical protein O4H49_01190 [Kiloniella laminariae]|uniref:DUF2147 domain-containing protein n=1 Tax=Kiloniella laminariae TaxID=454162 RepID=A0ABT4LE48_9PROT|nr:hypothetical protein [Kiloniella laminariae]MCZ4279370.1 hypothetical protein [Kiloniella laminariae]
MKKLPIEHWRIRGLVMAIALLSGIPQVEAANEWGIEHEQATELTGRVVDLACELSGNCPDSCGAGKRQLGLLLPDGKLYPVVKGGTNFAGGTEDLIAHCGKSVQVDGLLIQDPLMTLYFVQRVRSEKTGEWEKASKWGQKWLAANPGKDLGKWFRSDERIHKIVEEGGKLGIPGLIYEEE